MQHVENDKPVRLTEEMILRHIRLHMQRERITRKKLAERMKNTGRPVYDALSGRAALKVDTLMAMLEALEIDAVQFLARVRIAERRRIRVEEELEERKTPPE